MNHARSLSEQFRPKALDQFFGQERWLQENGIIRRFYCSRASCKPVFWGPPGCGKTSLASIYLASFSCPHLDFHPTRFQTTEVERALEEAVSSPLFRPTIFWIDEIHRLTRPQQDLLLRAVEDGSIAPCFPQQQRTHPLSCRAPFSHE